MARMMRRTAVVATALAAVATFGAPPAHADTDGWCGTTVWDYGSIGLNGCFRFYTDGTMDHEAYWRVVSPLVPSKWSACSLKIALFVNIVQTRMTTKSCLYEAQNNTGSYTTSGSRWTPTVGYCYRAVVAWTGTYDGNAVGSHENAYSVPFCG